MLGAAMPSLRGSNATPQDTGKPRVSQDAVAEPDQAGDDERALKEFLDIYRLEPGQNPEACTAAQAGGPPHLAETATPGRDDI